MKRPPMPSDSPAPAFVHVDVDDLWAIGECYGVPVPDSEAHSVSLQTLPRLGELFAELGITATFFVVGKDLEEPGIAALYRQLCSAGHTVANHSWSHPLNFRRLPQKQMKEQVTRSQLIIEQTLGITPVGFRAPGYGASDLLHNILAEQGFLYDSSLMPGPYGTVFRFLDARMRRKAGSPPVPGKTQYSRLRDTWNPLHPFSVAGGKLLEIPVATSPVMRLPFQAGVCMRLGERYFGTHLRAFENRPALPLLFLLHAADVADFSGIRHSFFQQNPYFAQPAKEKVLLLRSFLKQIVSARKIMLTEDWLQH